jgi:hypothetical protein
MCAFLGWGGGWGRVLGYLSGLHGFLAYVYRAVAPFHLQVITELEALDGIGRVSVTRTVNVEGFNWVVTFLSEVTPQLLAANGDGLTGAGARIAGVWDGVVCHVCVFVSCVCAHPTPSSIHLVPQVPQVPCRSLLRCVSCRAVTLVPVVAVACPQYPGP